VGGHCACAAAYSGKVCGHGIVLSWPYLPDCMANFSAAYEGDIVLHRGVQDAHMPLGAPGRDGKSLPLGAAALAEVKALLPASDTTFKASGAPPRLPSPLCAVPLPSSPCSHLPALV
jgi:hypothetical protein